MNRKNLKALAAAFEGDDRPGVVELDHDTILEWAMDDHGGRLPEVSAKPFAQWLSKTYYSYGMKGLNTTLGDVLQHGRAIWVGEAH